MQRVAIALTLIFKPKLLIMDEATTALDVVTQTQILNEIMELEKSLKIARIMITHDMSVVSSTCRHVVVMYAGRIMEKGAVEDVLVSPKHPYTQGLLRCLPRLDSDDSELLEPIEGTPVDLLALPKGCAFAPRCKNCMKVCLTQQPPTFQMGDGHTSVCWLHALDNREEAQEN